MNAERCRVVLVRPQIAANIGAVARIMRNFGLTDLRLVAPHADPLAEDARKLSTHGETLLHNAVSANDLGDAVADCLVVAGTSARTHGILRQQSTTTPRALMPQLAGVGSPVALVFGPERDGLTNDEVIRCHHLLTIPAHESYPVLNLAQAVAICLYEWYQAVQGRLTDEGPAIAPFDVQDRMFARLRQALTAIHFLWDTNADNLMHAIRHLLGRAQLSPQEVELLFGLARQIQWYADHHGPVADQPPRDYTGE